MYNVGQAQFGQGIPPGLTSQDWDGFFKAVTAGYGTDSAALTGGGSLRIESLEHTLMSVVQGHKHFVLFNLLKKSPASATVDEWTTLDDVGGRPGSGFNTELGTIKEQSGSYARHVALVKYLMTRRSTSIVQNVTNTIVAAKAQEEINGTLELLTSAEWAFWNGDSSVVPEEFDGFTKIIGDLNSSDHVIDANGGPLDSSGYELIQQGAETIYKRGGYGLPTDLFFSTAAQVDLDLDLDPAYRVPLTAVGDAGIQRGAPVHGIRTSWGELATHPGVFIEEGGIPRQAETPDASTATNPTKPANVTVVTAADTSSKFGAAHAGNYYWGVASVSKEGESQVTLTAQTAVAAGEKATLTITQPAAADQTGYHIYRSRLNGTNTLTDLRLMARVASAGATTAYVDQNRQIPGTSSGYILNLSPSYEAVGWRQLLPMTRFQLYPTVKPEDPWAQLLFGYLRVTKPKQNTVIKNILPARAKRIWDPFGAAA